MSVTCPVGFDVEAMQRRVAQEYDRVAREPHGEFHFHCGPEFAERLLRYDPDELASLPDTATARFAGVGNPHRIGPILSGQVVVDIGSGGGTDLLLAARRVGPTGRAIGVDPTAAMRAVAQRAAAQAGVGDWVEVREGSADQLPIESASADVVISNGVLNLTPDKHRAFAEIRRVLRPGGRLYLADVAVSRELTLKARSDIDLWAH